MNTAVVLIDGGYLRATRRGTAVSARHVKSIVTEIHSIVEAKLCSNGERLRWIRSYFYDTDPFEGTLRQPDGKILDLSHSFGARNQRRLLSELRYEDQVSVRSGVIRFRAWESVNGVYRPIFQQKGVDMKIGLDIAWLATKKIADIIVLVTADSDFVSPMKLARREGAIVCICTLTDNKLTPELAGNADIVVKIDGLSKQD